MQEIGSVDVEPFTGDIHFAAAQQAEPFEIRWLPDAPSGETAKLSANWRCTQP